MWFFVLLRMKVGIVLLKTAAAAAVTAQYSSIFWCMETACMHAFMHVQIYSYLCL